MKTSSIDTQVRKRSIVTKKKNDKNNPVELMVVNEEPGVETRIAILQDHRLEELYTERIKTATGVGNIYKGKVTNVESAIQAAFIEYGGSQRGFLHVTDLHPKYFPGKETSERVGKKIAKHNRPPIQKCLKKGDEILVQVLKEGIGTKGPTLTSYLSIPGRLSVMMPYMDKVGVSRKIEDEEERKGMRKVLDSLNLPEGFGFILRTAGMGKNKAEIKRDIAYLMRLWKIIEKRMKNVGAPCQLYNESDLLVRTIRDVLRPTIEAIVVDSDSSFERISNFLKIAAPRSARKIIQYRDAAPIFHSFDIERQIEEVHSREVQLPSGGRLVIDQTEALVAIDVNSGKSRDAKNSETNALNTNIEAADEICRQLRLRDLGGIVINDLIDMSKSANRKKVEQRFQINLERDRARSTVLPISRFGLLEMT
ncbi:MAG TPA: ribonuclease E, partial [Opitutae bacterium]|nr:ribonuclease E [Opitutae bacterium]